MQVISNASTEYDLTENNPHGRSPSLWCEQLLNHDQGLLYEFREGCHHSDQGIQLQFVI